jgi:hypothetical protein
MNEPAFIPPSAQSSNGQRWLATGALVVLCRAIAKLLIHLYTDQHYGYFTHELSTLQPARKPELPILAGTA